MKMAAMKKDVVSIIYTMLFAMFGLRFNVSMYKYLYYACIYVE